MGKFIYTVYDIVAGRGLTIAKQHKKIPEVEVDCGDGIKFGEDDSVTVNNGPGLKFTEGYRDHEMQIGGSGIGPRRKDKKLTIDNYALAGKGLVPGEEVSLDVDCVPDINMQQQFKVVTETRFKMDGYRLVFCTTYTTMIVHRNFAGIVLGIEKGECETEFQPLNIDGYGVDDGYSIKCDNNEPFCCKSNNVQPSFYK